MARTRIRVAFAALVVIATILTGCTVSKTTTSSAPQALTTDLIEPVAIDPYNLQDTDGAEIVSNIFEGLVKFDAASGKVKPAVAERWEANKDATIWIFHLKKGTKFHNGREVEAGDFKYAWERIANPKLDPASPISYHLAAVKGYDEMQNGVATQLAGVVVKDKYTLEVDLAYPFADFIYVVGNPALTPVPKEEVEKDPAAFAEKPIGNGPFMMAEPWKHDQYIKIKRFDGYTGEKPKLDQVTFDIFKDDVSGYNEFQAGDLDYLKTIPTGQLKTAVAKYGKSADGYEPTDAGRVMLGTEASVYMLSINDQNPILKNADLRRAMSLAINRDAINQLVFSGTRRAATGLVAPGVVGFKENAGAYCKYDKKQAQEFLKKAGYPDGNGLPVIKMVYNPGQDHEKVMEAVQNDFKAIGIRTELQVMEPAQLGPYMHTDKHEIIRRTWSLDYPILDNALYPLFYSKNIDQDNAARYSNPEVDKLLIDGRKELDEKKRVADYRKAEQLILDDAAVIPLNFYSHRAVAQKWVKGLVYGPLSLTDYSHVYIEK
ncbi:MAG: ABC transporter substrate-binding protein [Chloroflexi bacterium]|nr:ABC transporter substrate-binding protein [Chloroflexota bacterium]